MNAETVFHTTFRSPTGFFAKGSAYPINNRSVKLGSPGWYLFTVTVPNTKVSQGAFRLELSDAKRLRTLHLTKRSSNKLSTVVYLSPADQITLSFLQSVSGASFEISLRKISKDLVAVLALALGTWRTGLGAFGHRPSTLLTRNDLSKFMRSSRDRLAEKISMQLWSFKSDLPASDPTYAAWFEKYGATTKCLPSISGRGSPEGSNSLIRRSKELTIGVVMPVYKPDLVLLAEALESLRLQTYEAWELQICVDGHIDSDLTRVLDAYVSEDPRIAYQVLDANMGISKASNVALGNISSRCSLVAFMDQDDLLEPGAFSEIIKAKVDKPYLRLIYTDEDKIDALGMHSSPHFKTDWNPYLLLSYNYINHLCVMDIQLVRELGGLRSEFDGSQDYDLLLRATAKLHRSELLHIPKVLYHWRMVPGSVALEISSKAWAVDAGRKAVEDALTAMGRDASVVPAPQLPIFSRVHFELASTPKVSIVIPSRDNGALLVRCVESVLDKTDYVNFELLIVDNQSVLPYTAQVLETLSSTERVTVIEYDQPFNFSAINNWAINKVNGSVVCLLNDDTEVVDPGWLREMVSLVQFQEVGAVGAKLLYDDGTVQHAGVLLGQGGVAGHYFKFLDANEPGYFGRNQVTHCVSAVTGACLVVRKEVFDEVGGLDEANLGVAFNDVDLCLRIQERGYWNVFTPYSVLIHHESKSRGLRDAHSARHRKETEYMIQRWGDRLERDPFYNPNLTLDGPEFSLSSPPRQ